jgi:hypothetical protein
MDVARNPDKYKNVELSHELFTVKEGGFEAIYLNCEPTGAGMMYDHVVGGGVDGEDVWKSTLYRTKNGSSSKSRMGTGS